MNEDGSYEMVSNSANDEINNKSKKSSSVSKKKKNCLNNLPTTINRVLVM